MKDESKRALISAFIFVLLFLSFKIFVRSSSYNVEMEAIRFFSAVLGTGFYWVGSRK